jgi:hypothetical protein
LGGFQEQLPKTLPARLVGVRDGVDPEGHPADAAVRVVGVQVRGVDGCPSARQRTLFEVGDRGVLGGVELPIWSSFPRRRNELLRSETEVRRTRSATRTGHDGDRGGRGRDDLQDGVAVEVRS